MTTDNKTATDKTQYMLLFHGYDWDKGLSPDQIQKVMTQWMAWFEGLKEAGTAKAGQPLYPEGKVVSGKNGQTVSDGPFAESKEAIAGYFLLDVADLDEALAVARRCPALPYGMQVEVRPVAPRCRASEYLEHAAAATSAR